MIRKLFTLALVSGIVAHIVPAVVTAAPAEPGNPRAALYNGNRIDLSKGWQGARACIELGDRTECYTTEQEMLAAHPDVFGAPLASRASSTSSVAASCASSLRLYDGTSYTGAVVAFTTRAATINLSAHGFDNRASSYKVGACSSNLYSGPNLGGSPYPGATGANAVATSMASGWNNVVSSVYIG